MPQEVGEDLRRKTTSLGRSYVVNSHKILNSCVEMIIQKIQMNGVMIKLEKYGSDPAPVPNGLG